MVPLRLIFLLCVNYTIQLKTEFGWAGPDSTSVMYLNTKNLKYTFDSNHK